MPAKKTPPHLLRKQKVRRAKKKVRVISKPKSAKKHKASAIKKTAKKKSPLRVEVPVGENKSLETEHPLVSQYDAKKIDAFREALQLHTVRFESNEGHAPIRAEESETEESVPTALEAGKLMAVTEAVLSQENISEESPMEDTPKEDDSRQESERIQDVDFSHRQKHALAYAGVGVVMIFVLFFWLYSISSAIEGSVYEKTNNSGEGSSLSDITDDFSNIFSETNGFKNEIAESVKGLEAQALIANEVSRMIESTLQESVTTEDSFKKAVTQSVQAQLEKVPESSN